MKASLLFLSILLTGAVNAAVYSGTFSADLNGITISIETSIDSDADKVTFTCTGPSDTFFAFGFGGSQMSGTYAFVLNSTAGDVQERKLGEHNPGSELTSSVNVLSSDVSNNEITIVFERALTGTNADYYDFTAGEGNINMIYSKGTAQSLAYHGLTSKGTTTLAITDQSATSIEETNTPTVALFPNPATDFIQLQFNAIQQGLSASIMDAKGAMIQQFGANSDQSFQFDVSALEPGTYYLAFRAEQNSGYYLFVKQ